MEDCPDGRMDRSKMQIMFKSVIPEVTLQILICLLTLNKFQEKLKSLDGSGGWNNGFWPSLDNIVVQCSSF